jgi:hypothetical protein
VSTSTKFPNLRVMGNQCGWAALHREIMLHLIGHDREADRLGGSLDTSVDPPDARKGIDLRQPTTPFSVEAYESRPQEQGERRICAERRRILGSYRA